MSRKSKPIIPMAYLPNTDFTATMYYVGFPERWKDELIRIQKASTPQYKEFYNINISKLKALSLAWLEGAVYVNVLKNNTPSDKWLISCRPINTNILFSIIQIWIVSLSDSHKISTIDKEAYKNLLDTMDISELELLAKSSEEHFFNEDGTVKYDNAYNAFSTIVRDRLIGKEITIDGIKHRLYASGSSELITEPVFFEKKREQGYSYVFEFSLQTTPPNDKVMLLCKSSIRRWLGDAGCVLEEKMNVHVQVNEPNTYKYYIMPCSYNWKERVKLWDCSHLKCFNLYNSNSLPSAEEILQKPANYSQIDGKRILCPFNSRLNIKFLIGNGVSIFEKTQIIREFATLLDDCVCRVPSVLRLDGKNTPFESEFNPNRFFQSVDASRVRIEIYARNCDSAVSDALATEISKDFKGDSNCIIVKKEVADDGWISSLKPKGKEGVLLRAREIERELEKMSEVTGALVVLPSADCFSADDDPKQAIRNGFALTNRITQFITPEGYASSIDKGGHGHNVSKAVKDLYRQFGYLQGLKNKKTPLASIMRMPVTGFWLFANRNTYYGKAQFLPVFVTADFESGKIYVECEAFSKPKVLYKEAGIELAKLSKDNDIKNKSDNAKRSCIKRKLTDLSFTNRDRDVIFLSIADGNTRLVAPCLSNSQISKSGLYEDGSYIPSIINVGDKNSEEHLKLLGTKVRVFRLRVNDEVPDYCTELSETKDKNSKATQSSGIYKYGSVFWCVAQNKNGNDYKQSYKLSRSAEQKKRTALYFKQRKSIEIFPMQLQEGDDVNLFLNHINSLRDCHIQFNDKTELPLPLHLAECLGEYFLINIFEY